MSVRQIVAKHQHPLSQDQVVLTRSLLTSAQVAPWRTRADARYRALEEAGVQGGPVAASGLTMPGQRFVATASSFTIGAVLSDEDLRPGLIAIATGSAGEWIRDKLGTRVACAVDQSWVRRQYAPRNYPLWHRPHGWHQDGALGFDFPPHADGDYPFDAVLSMVTCWISLDPCGADAPGLEFASRRLDGLLAPSELTDEQVRARFAREEFWRPVMEPGDALLFRGDVLHRTHVTPSMTRTRTSIELRFFAANEIPARLKNDRFVPLDL